MMTLLVIQYFIFNYVKNTFSLSNETEQTNGSVFCLYNRLTAAFCSRLALPREITLFFLEPRANVNLSPGIRPGGSGDRSRCPFGVSALNFGSVGVKRRRWRKETNEKRREGMGKKNNSIERLLLVFRCCHTNRTCYSPSI